MLKSSTNLADCYRNLMNKNQSVSLLFGSSSNLTQIIKKKQKLKQKDYKKSLVLAENQLQNEIKIYQWRIKTQLPIVKILNFQLLEKKQQNQNINFEIEVCISPQLKKLIQLQNISFNQALYVLKQSLIGFQRLYHRFGFLRILPSMILINKNNKCVVWINQDLFSNKKLVGQESVQTVKQQPKMVQMLANIICGITQKNTNSSVFFQKLSQVKNFCQAIKLIQKFSSENKILIPQSLITFRTQSNKYSAQLQMLKCSLNLKEPIKNQKEKITYSSKIPSFIKKFSKKNSDQNEEPFIFQRCLTNKSQKIDIDRSMTNISRNLSSNSLAKQPILFGKKSLLQKRRSNKQAFNSQQFWEKMNIEQKQIDEDSSKLFSIQIPKKLVNDCYYSSGQSSSVCPLSPISPLYSQPMTPFKQVQTQMSIGKDSKLSYYSFDSKNNFKTFYSTQNMFLTVIQTRNKDCNYSNISNNISLQVSKKPFMKLNQMKADLQSLSNGSDKKNDNKDLLSPIYNQKQNRHISNCKSIKQLSEIQTNQKRHRKISQHTVNYSQKKQNKTPSFLTAKKYQNRQYLSLNFKSNKVNNQQEQNQGLRETIMSKNGWRNLTLFDREKMNQSIIQGGEIEIKSQYTTLQLQILGGMGKDLVSSMIADDVQNLEDINFQYKVRINKEREREILNVLQ